MIPFFRTPAAWRAKSGRQSLRCCLRVSRAAAAVLMLLLATPASAGKEGKPPWLDLDERTDPTTHVVQKRRFMLNHEVTLLLGDWPSDPFSKGAAFGLGYTLHFNDAIAWEVASLTYIYGFDTDLKNQLIRIVALQRLGTPNIATLTSVVASHFVLKPFYGKQTFFDQRVLHLEFFLQAGPALALLQKVADQALAPGLDWGFGARLWLTQSVSLRAELAQVLFYTEGHVRQALHAQGGFAFTFGGDA